MNVHVDVTVGQTVQWMHSTYKTLLTPVQSNGSLGIFESVCQPNTGPARHVHHDADETFYILQGEMTFWLEGELMKRGAGDCVFIPRGKHHTFVVVGSEPARMLVMMTPGGFEGFFAEVAARNLRAPEDMPEISAIGTRYHLEFVGPPLGA